MSPQSAPTPTNPYASNPEPFRHIGARSASPLDLNAQVRNSKKRDIYSPPTVNNDPSTNQKRTPYSDRQRIDYDQVEMGMEYDNQTKDRPDPHLPPTVGSKTEEQKRLEDLYFSESGGATDVVFDSEKGMAGSAMTNSNMEDIPSA